MHAAEQPCFHTPVTGSRVPDAQGPHALAAASAGGGAVARHQAGEGLSWAVHRAEGCVGLRVWGVSGVVWGAQGV
jgi:hypothetical protein